VTPGPLLLLAALALAASAVLGRRRPRLWLALATAGAGAGIAAALRVLGGTDWAWHGTFRLWGEPLQLRLDALGASFLLLVGVVGAAGAVYSSEYWSDARYPVSAPRGRGLWSALLFSLGYVLLSTNGLHFLVGWELFTLSGYFLITLERERHEVRAAGWLYLAASHAGTLCLLAFFALLAAHTGSWELGPLTADAELAPLFWLALVGFGVKGGFFPLHVWLPAAHASAPSHVSAILSGVSIKMGVYGLLRFSGWLPTPAAAGWIVVGLGASGALAGIAFALAQHDLKRLLAYCSVENVGVILIGLGGALLGAAHGDAPWGRLALAGALLHVWNHGLFKSLLFLGAGSVLHATGTREISRLGGLWRAMPWTAGLFALGAVAICGLPPLNGFVSEWLVYLGLLDAVTSHNAASWAAMPAVIVLGATGALALASFVKAAALVFLGAPRTRAAAQAHECGPAMRAPMLALAGLCLASAWMPGTCWGVLRRAVDAWRPGWESAEAPVPLATLGAVQLAFAVLACAAAGWLWRKARGERLRRAVTWDCGFVAPSARMQYTGGSFASIAAGWFAWMLRPERVQRRPRGPFPARAERIDRVPETVLERVIGPAGAWVMRLSTAVRRLQHGRLQFYIVYVMVGVVALGLLAFLEGAP
jgi:hydrogenase-4 component B